MTPESLNDCLDYKEWDAEGLSHRFFDVTFKKRFGWIEAGDKAGIVAVNLDTLWAYVYDEEGDLIAKVDLNKVDRQ